MRRISAVVAVALTLPAFAAGATKDVKLALVAYSTPKDAYAKIIPAFQKTPAGKGVSFSQSYGASGEQARAVVQGLGADVVELSLAPDITTLVQAHIVASNWDKNAYNGIVSRSIVVFIVRNGNPKHIRTWNDLLKPGVQVVTPNPFTSGGARWNVMAAYGGALRAGKSPKQAIAYLTELFKKHVVAQPSSAREALQTFLAGKGDVALQYENEAILAKNKGQSVNWVAPKATILIENPVAVTSTTKHATEAKAFVKFLYAAQAQSLFAETGYRPVLRSVQKKFRFTNPKQLFTIGYVGGWSKVQKKFFDPNNSVMATIERGLGG
ncbi:MAG: sulfate ABC transporter substrate-binding protein [Actinobacteria bacterium]|nr:MAG: sulfate ABC transporter substrate-binding protein [Actinomycetota bacterium]